MRQFPFSSRPDSLFLMLPRHGSGISVRAFESALGRTDEMLCYASGVLFGRLLTDSRDQYNRLIVDLLPNLDPQRQYDWPGSDEFCQVLLSQTFSVPGAYLHCESDTDQGPVRYIRDEAILVKSVKNLVAFCIDGAIPCPSFAYGHPRLAICYAEPGAEADTGQL